MKSTGIVTAIVLMGASALLPAAEKAGATDVAVKGQRTYTRYCVSCHGVAGKGDGPLANDLRVPVPALTTLAARNGGTFPFDRVVKIIENGESLRGHGSADMPAWGDAFKRTTGTGEKTVDAALQNLAEYLRSIQAK